MLSVVIPAFNEEKAISDTVEAVKNVLKKAGDSDSEIIVVDDGSNDATGDLARKAGATVIRNLQNLGYGRSLKNGIAAAGNETIVISDADGTYPVERIPDLVATYREGFDMVVGARAGNQYRESALKWPLRLILKWLVEFTAGRCIPDVNSGLRVFSKAAVVPLFPHLSNTFSFTTSLTLIYVLQHRCVHYIPIDYNPRVGTTKVRLFRDSLRTLQYIVQTALYYNPLKIFLVLCGLTLAFAVFCFAVGLWLHITTAMWLGLGSTLLTILIFAMGLLADLLRQIIVQKNDD